MVVFSKPARTGETSQRLFHLSKTIKSIDDDLPEETLIILRRFQVFNRWILKDWQMQGVDSIHRGHDLFMKVGIRAGKSMIFLAMIEAILNGIVLVLCPLLSLMQDQV